MTRESLIWAHRNLLRLSREPRSWISDLVTPLVFFLGFYAALGDLLGRQGVAYGQYLTSAIVVQALLFTALSTGYWIAEDAAGGVLARALSLPIARSSVVAGRLLADITRALIVLFTVIVVGIALGFGFQGVGSTFGFVLIAILFYLAMGAGCAWIGLILADGQRAVHVLSLPYLAGFTLSTALVPADQFPDRLQTIVAESPVSRATEALRILAAGGDVVSRPVLLAVGWLASLAFLFGAGAAKAFGRVV